MFIDPTTLQLAAERRLDYERRARVRLRQLPEEWTVRPPRR